MLGLTREFWEACHSAPPTPFPMMIVVAGEIDVRIATTHSVETGGYPIAPEQIELARELVRKLERLPHYPLRTEGIEFHATETIAAELDYYFYDEHGTSHGYVTLTDGMLREVRDALWEIDKGFEYPL